MGIVKFADGQPIDGALIDIKSAADSATNISRSIRSDGSGFFGAVAFEPGSYLIQVRRDGAVTTSATASVAAGQVTLINLRVEQ